MTVTRSYCDWNASAPILPEAADAVVRALALGNPSSVHAEGRAARAAVEVARADVAALVGVEPAQVTFTSGGTEAAATILQPMSEDEVLFIGNAEHPCVLAGGRYQRDRIGHIPVDSDGRVEISEVDIAVGMRRLDPHQVQVAVQIANNETGAITPPETFAHARERGWVVVADAVQAAGRIDLAPYLPCVDVLFLSAHKIGGPKGVGAFVTRKDACGVLRPLITGGGQERGMRSGTENVAGIAGFGVAARHARANLGEMARIAALRDRFETGLVGLAADAVVFSAGVPRLPNTSLVAIPGLVAETALIACDLDGIALSSGAACSSGKVTRSHVLKAMGIPDALALSALRVSFGWSSSDSDVTRLLNSLERQIARLRTRQPSAA